MYFKCTLPDGSVKYKILNDQDLSEIIDSKKILDDFDCVSWSFKYENMKQSSVYHIDIRQYMTENPVLGFDEGSAFVEKIPDNSYEGLVSNLSSVNSKNAYIKDIFVEPKEEDYYSENPYSDDPEDYSNDY
jgi:hypothetical protein